MINRQTVRVGNMTFEIKFPKIKHVKSIGEFYDNLYSIFTIKQYIRFSVPLGVCKATKIALCQYFEQ